MSEVQDAVNGLMQAAWIQGRFGHPARQSLMDATTSARDTVERLYDAKAAECAAVIQDCRVLCNALQRIEAGEAEPRMIARRTLEHWSEKATVGASDRQSEHWSNQPRKCAVCDGDIPRWVPWPWWEAGKPVHQLCFGESVQPSEHREPK